MSEKETILKVNPEKKTEVKLKGLTKIQAKLLRAGKLPLVALAGILGGAVYGRSGSRINMGTATDISEDPVDTFPSDKDIPQETESEEVEIEEVEVDDVEIDAPMDDGLVNLKISSNVQFADAVTDEMSFGDAFDTAREQLGGGGFFMWKGQPYSTYTKEEWDSFSDDQKKEFFEAFKEQSDFENAEEEPTDMDTDIEPEVEPEVDPDDANEDSEGETEIEPENKTEPEVEPEPEQEPEDVEPEPEPEEVKPDEQPEEVEPDLEPENALPDEEPEEVEPDAEDIEDVEIEDEFVELEELGTEDEIFDGLNDGEAFEEEDNFGEDFDI